MPWESIDISSVWEGDTLRVDQADPFMVQQFIALRGSTLLVIDERGCRRDIQHPCVLERVEVGTEQLTLLPT